MLNLAILLLFGFRLIIGTLMILLWKCLKFLIFRRMAAGRTSLCLVVLRWLVLGVYVPAPELAFEGSVWGKAEEYGDARLERCRALMPVPGPLQTVQRAGFWCASIALQAYWPCHLGIDNLNVAGSIDKLLDRGCLVKPLNFVKDGDFQARGRDTVRVTKGRVHATDADVEQDRVLADKVGNAEADAAVDLGRRHQSELLMDVRRNLLKVRNHWYPIMLQLHRFMIAVARVTVNHDGRGGTAPDPLVWVGRRHAGLTFALVSILLLYLEFVLDASS